MNKILRNCFVAALAMMSVSAMAQTTVTFDAAVDKGTRTSSDAGEDQITKDGVTIAVSNGCMNLTDQYRCYKNATFTVTSTVGNIQKVEFTCTAEGTEKYGPGCFTDATAGAYTFEGKNGTWTGDAATFTMTASTNQVRMNTVVVTVAGGAPSAGQVWDFTILPTQAVDGTGNLTCNIDGGVLPDDGGEGWGIIYNNEGIADGSEFMAKAGEVFEPTKGLKWSALPNKQMVIYRNYPENYGGKYLFTNKACEVMIPAKAGQVIEIIAGTAKNNKKITSQDVVETFETGDGEVLKGALVDGTEHYDYKPYTLTVAVDNPYLAFENNICIQKITVKDAGDTPAEQGMAWDFTKWSDATVAALKTEAAKGISGGTWSDVESETKTSEWPKDKCYWQVAVQPNDLKAGDVEIIETKGLKFTNTSDRALAIAVNYPLADQDESKAFGPYHGGAYLWLGGKNINYFIIPNVAAGSVIEMGVESHKITDARGVKLFAGTDETGTELKAPDGTDVAYPKTYTEQKWQMPADATTTDVCVRNNNGCHIYFIKVVSDASGISTVKAQKVQNGAIYNLAGQKVGKDYKGIVIVNGRKYIQK